MLEGASLFERLGIWGVLGMAIAGLLYAVFLARQILREDKGTREMQEIAEAIQIGRAHV